MSRIIPILLFYISFLTGCGGSCGNEIVQTINSPSGKFKAIVFSRNCGATTGFNTQVSVLHVDESLPNEGGNTFITNGSVPIVLHWQTNSALHISNIGNTSPIKKIKQGSGVVIRYAN